jgi:hypothetical chaperone protein
MSACGLDFGTSNTTFGHVVDRVPVLVPLESRHLTIPSAVFFNRDGGGVLIGRTAVHEYVDGTPGRLMRSLKSVLGTSLIDEITQVGRERRTFRDVIAYYLGAVKRRAEEVAGREFRNVVHGRPVHFVDNDPEADRRAEATLEEIVRGIGFKNVTFQFEPIAAAFDYERQIAREEIALIADIGGGTSDFSIVRLSPERHRKADRQDDILGNDGVRIGGTDFDRKLNLGLVMPLLGHGSPMKRARLDAPTSYFHDLATWSNINRMYERGVASDIRNVRREASEPKLFDRLLRVLEEQRGHTLAMDVEQSKIALSDTATACFSLEWLEPGLKVAMSRADLLRQTAELAEAIGARIGACLKQARVAAGSIDTVFLTGGSVQLAHVRRRIAGCVPAARIVDGDTFGAVGKGLAIEANRRFGAAM